MFAIERGHPPNDVPFPPSLPRPCKLVSGAAATALLCVRPNTPLSTQPPQVCCGGAPPGWLSWDGAGNYFVWTGDHFVIPAPSYATLNDVSTMSRVRPLLLSGQYMCPPFPSASGGR
eukprot:357265-Chlamydomonas_euryale.AAC.1